MSEMAYPLYRQTENGDVFQILSETKFIRIYRSLSFVCVVAGENQAIVKDVLNPSNAWPMTEEEYNYFAATGIEKFNQYAHDFLNIQPSIQK